MTMNVLPLYALFPEADQIIWTKIKELTLWCEYLKQFYDILVVDALKEFNFSQCCQRELLKTNG